MVRLKRSGMQGGFDVISFVSPNKLLNTQSRCRWFEMPWRPCNSGNTNTTFFPTSTPFSPFVCRHKKHRNSSYICVNGLLKLLLLCLLRFVEILCQYMYIYISILTQYSWYFEDTLLYAHVHTKKHVQSIDFLEDIHILSGHLHIYQNEQNTCRVNKLHNGMYAWLNKTITTKDR